MLGVFSISVFLEPGAQNSACLTNVFLVTFTTLNTVYHPTLFFFLKFVLGGIQQALYGAEKFVVRVYAVGSECTL